MRHAYMRIMRARGERLSGGGLKADFSLPFFVYRRGTVVWKKWGVLGDLEMGRLHATWAWAKREVLGIVRAAGSLFIVADGIPLFVL